MKIRKVKSLTVVAMLPATIAGWWNGYSFLMLIKVYEVTSIISLCNDVVVLM